MARYAYGDKTRVESCRCIDVLRWNRLGYYRLARWFMWPEPETASRRPLFRVETECHAVTLKYRSRSCCEGIRAMLSIVSALIGHLAGLAVSGLGLCTRRDQTACFVGDGSPSYMRAAVGLPAGIVIGLRTRASRSRHITAASGGRRKFGCN
jgi:hypothetical protein